MTTITGRDHETSIDGACTVDCGACYTIQLEASVRRLEDRIEAARVECRDISARAGLHMAAQPDDASRWIAQTEMAEKIVRALDGKVKHE